MDNVNQQIHSNDALGIFQSDVVIRTAILAGIADLRANPYLLEYVFASLPADALTFDQYGDKEVQNAKQWFLGTGDIRTVMATQMNAGDKLPCITIELMDSSEADENTLGDVHYQYLEDLSTPWPDLCDPFTPTSVIGGVLTLPDATAAQLDVADGMVVVTKAGETFVVCEAPAANVVVIAKPSTNVDFRSCTIRGSRPAFVRHMESSSFRESYSIGIHVHGEPVYLTYLHSIIVFILLRYREVLLEGRGYERTSFSSSEAARNAFFAQENVFSRYISITGFVRQFWPKQIVPKITSTLVDIAIATSDGVDIPPVATDTSQYGLRGPDQSPEGPEAPFRAGPRGPAIAPAENRGMDTSLPPGVPFGEDGPEGPAI